MVEGVKRAYRSEVREAAAQQTRLRVLDAAAELFVERGFVGTTLKGVAERAGVGERTLYDRFGDKVELFEQVMRYRTRGDDRPIPGPERPEVLAVFETTDADEIIELHMAYGADLLDRAGDLIMAAIAASGSDSAMASHFASAYSSVHGIHLKVTRHLESLGHLKPGLDAVTAADILHSLAHPAIHQSLRRQRRWSQSRYRQWLIDIAKQQVLAA